MKYDIIVPALIAFGVSVILSPIIIPFLKKLKFGQFVRDDGPESHLKKSGTPTMGGLIILFSIVITSLFYIKDHKEIVPILFATLGFGLVGFLDDFIKVVMKRSLGPDSSSCTCGQTDRTARRYSCADCGADCPQTQRRWPPTASRRPYRRTHPAAPCPPHR